MTCVTLSVFVTVSLTCLRTMLLSKLLQHISRFASLRHVSHRQITTFVRLSSYLKRDINLPQPLLHSDVSKPPRHLPPSVIAFLSSTTGIPLKYIDSCWRIVRYEVWDTEAPLPVSQEDQRLFRRHGWPYGLSAQPSYHIYLLTNETHS